MSSGGKSDVMSRDDFGVLMLLWPVWPIAGIWSAVRSYIRHRDRIEPERRVSAALYVIAVVVCGGVAGFFGVIFGVSLACSGPRAGNLCGLVGVLIVGPIFCGLAMFLIGLALSLIPPAKPDG